MSSLKNNINLDYTPLFKINFKEDSYWINIDKPRHYSSAKTVAIVKGITKAKKVGHAGTLDPFATGVLAIAINKSTKQSELLMNERKSYKATIRFGEFRDSDDITGEIESISESRISKEDFFKVLTKFIGKIEQTPSKFSAIKISGERAYKLARQKHIFEMPKRVITIYKIKLTEFNLNYCDIEIESSKGTYIRSLVRSICQEAKIAGYTEKLKRTKIGMLKIETTISLDELKNIVNFNGSVKEKSFLALNVENNCNRDDLDGFNSLES